MSNQDAKVVKNGNKSSKPTKSAPAPEKVVIYIEVDSSLKQTMERLAKQHNRKLTGECVQAFQDYIAKNKPPADDAD